MQNQIDLLFLGIEYQHVHGTDNARCLITILITGQIDPVRVASIKGQNNVQGASDAGLIQWFS